jgi:hypothetical protein
MAIVRFVVLKDIANLLLCQLAARVVAPGLNGVLYVPPLVSPVQVVRINTPTVVADVKGVATVR